MFLVSTGYSFFRLAWLQPCDAPFAGGSVDYRPRPGNRLEDAAC